MLARARGKMQSIFPLLLARVLLGLLDAISNAGSAPVDLGDERSAKRRRWRQWQRVTAIGN